MFFREILNPDITWNWTPFPHGCLYICLQAILYIPVPAWSYMLIQVCPFSKFCDFSLHFGHDHCPFVNVSVLETSLCFYWPAFWSKADSARCASHRSSSMTGPKRPKKFTAPTSATTKAWCIEQMRLQARQQTSQQKVSAKVLFLVHWEHPKSTPWVFWYHVFTRSSPSGTPSLQIWAELLCHKNAHFQSAPRWRGAWSQQPHTWPSKCTRCKMRPNTSACLKNLGVVLHLQVMNPHGFFSKTAQSIGAVLEDVAADSCSKEHFKGTDNPVLSWHLDYFCSFRWP